MDQESGDSKDQRNDGGGGEVRYAGVVFQSGKYRARIHDKTKKRGVWLGTFPTAEEAARAYDQAAIARGRHFNCLHFPEEHPDAAAAARGAAPPMLPLMTAEHPDASATGAANASTMTAAAAATVSSSSTSSMATREVTDAATAGAAANASTMTAAAATSSSSTSSMATKEVADEFDYLKGLKLDDLGVLPHLDDE